jgi:hypothetical protein
MKYRLTYLSRARGGELARRGRWLLPSLALLAVSLLGFDRGPARADESLNKAGTVSIEQYQIAFIGSGNLGGGTLQFNGQSYPFTIGGLGIGGFGISKITAHGEVYNLKDVVHFPGAYGQARYGIVVGTASTGELWLQNADGVYLHLKADREGLALSLGADAIYINMD